jgi:UDPglucose 6-dehydrogenase
MRSAVTKKKDGCLSEFMLNVAVIGTGYVGLVTGACLAHIGHNVICVDCDESKIQLLNKGGVPIFEPGLDELIHANVAAGRLSFTSETKKAVTSSTVVFIAVSTPPRPDGGVDLTYVERVARDIATLTNGYKLIVDKSTVPVRTGQKVAETISRYSRKKLDIDVVSNPEFLREGFAIDDFLKPDRIVVGTQSERPIQMMKDLYAPLNAPMLFTDINSAELIKHASNSFLALKISYINAISVICEATGANVQQVSLGMGMDKRIGNRFLDASLGFGGSCFPKDLSAFITISRENGYDFRLLNEVQNINSAQMERFLKKIKDTLWVLKDKTIGVLGLAFKQNTDDIRMSPALTLCQSLSEEGAKLRVYDPAAMEKSRAVLPQAIYLDDMNDVPVGCDAIVIATEWPLFRKLDLDAARRHMVCPIMFDGRNMFDPKEMDLLGWVYKSIGR